MARIWDFSVSFEPKIVANAMARFWSPGDLEMVLDNTGFSGPGNQVLVSTIFYISHSESFAVFLLMLFILPGPIPDAEHLNRGIS